MLKRVWVVLAGLGFGPFLLSAASPALIVPVSGSSQSAAVGGTFSLPLTVVVKDTQHMPVAGATVTFTAPAFGPSGGFGSAGAAVVTAVTNAQGLAAVPALVANSVPGAFTVVATVSGVAQAASFNLFIATTAGTLVGASGSPFGTAGVSGAVAVGDFNNDGLPDIAIASTAGSVTILTGNGLDGFMAGPGGPFAVGGAPLALAVADFNGDGNLDIAAANSGSNNVTVLLGNGTGAFTMAPGGTYAVGVHPASVVAADFNGDGIPDLAVANLEDGTVTVLLGSGTGTLAAAAGSPLKSGTRASFLAVADVNGDGVPDLLVTDDYENQLDVLLGTGAGGFTVGAGSPYAVGRQPFGVVLGDFNHDGKLDAAVTNELDNDVTVLLGDGTGKFAAGPGSPFAAGTNPARLVTADFDGDGNLDLAVISPLNDTLTVLRGDGQGRFAAALATSLGGGTSPGDIAVTDFNGDGRADLAISNATLADIVVYLGALTPTNTELVSSSGGQTVPLTVEVSDAGPSFAAPTGSVTFFDGKVEIGSVNLVNQTAAFTAAGLAAGAHSLTAVYSGDAYNATSTSGVAAATVVIAPNDPLSFGAIPNHLFGDKPFPLFATSGSTTPILFTVVSGPATVTGNMVTLTGVGMVTIRASQVASGSSPGGSVTQSFTVAQGMQTILFQAIGTPNINDHTETLRATGGGSGNAVVFTVISGPVSISGDTLTLLGLGTAVVEATQAGNANYLAAAPVFDSFQIVSNLQSIFIYPIGNHVATDAPFLVQAQGGPSGNPVVFTVVSGPATVSTGAVVSGSGGTIYSATVTLTGMPGTVVLQATQAGNTSYSAAPAVMQSFTVTAAAVTAQLTSVANAASYQAGTIAPNSFATLFGNGLAATVQAPSASYPTSLGGIGVTVTDATGLAALAMLQYVSPGQVNFVVPAGLASGAGTVAVVAGGVTEASIPVTIANVTPGLFSEPGAGSIAAGFALSVAADGTETYTPLANCPDAGGCQVVTVPANAQYLVLYGTGIRNVASVAGVAVTIAGREAAVLYASAQSQYPGLDQLNVQVPAGLAGSGPVALTVTVDGVVSNPVNVAF